MLLASIIVGATTNVKASSLTAPISSNGTIIYEEISSDGKYEIVTFNGNENVFYVFNNTVLISKYSLDKANHSYTETLYSKDKNNINYNLDTKVISSKKFKSQYNISESIIDISTMSVPSGYTYLGRIKYSVSGETAGSRSITFYSKEQSLGVQTTTVNFWPGLTVSAAIANLGSVLTKMNLSSVSEIINSLIKTFTISVIGGVITQTLAKTVSGECTQSYLHGTSNFGTEQILSGKTYKILTPSATGTIKISYLNEDFTAYNYRIHSQNFGLGVFSWFFSDSYYQIYSWS